VLVGVSQGTLANDRDRRPLTAGVWSLHGLVTYYVLLVIELAKRIVHIAGITTQPNETWMMQVARNLTDAFNGALAGKSHLIVDRDRKYTAQFRHLIAESKTAVIRLPPRSPNLNAFGERFRALDQRRMPRSDDLRRSGESDSNAHRRFRAQCSFLFWIDGAR
jgi:hypothetical protein